jgi:zinc/manganese transport system substrate-binding protein
MLLHSRPAAFLRSSLAAPRCSGRAGLTILIAALALSLTGCGSATKAAGPGQIAAVGAENQYANVIQQIGGRYISVTAIMSNPNTDPHSFEASPSVAKTVNAARLIVQNGVGYDSFMDNIEAATANSSRKVITVQKLLGLPNSTPNPHLWYSPRTMPTVAAALAKTLTQMQPAHAAYFSANLRRFDTALKPWLKAIAQFKARYPGTTVATTEPVGDYMLQAVGTHNLTPWQLQADIMNGVDPAAQDITLQDGLFSSHKVKVFVYNQQVTDTLTQEFKAAAARAGIPVVGVYETMPTGYGYQRWMLAEVEALQRAVADHKSTEKL